jgi:hypothetical protein
MGNPVNVGLYPAVESPLVSLTKGAPRCSVGCARIGASGTLELISEENAQSLMELAHTHLDIVVYAANNPLQVLLLV